MCVSLFRRLVSISLPTETSFFSIIFAIVMELFFCNPFACTVLYTVIIILYHLHPLSLSIIWMNKIWTLKKALKWRRSENMESSKLQTREGLFVLEVNLGVILWFQEGVQFPFVCVYGFSIHKKGLTFPPHLFKAHVFRIPYFFSFFSFSLCFNHTWVCVINLLQKKHKYSGWLLIKKIFIFKSRGWWNNL